MRATPLLVHVLASFALSTTTACSTKPGHGSGPAHTHSVPAARPVSGLPSYVVAPAGALTLFADYDHATAGEISLYLVNRTSEHVELPSQDGDLYVKLEVERDGAWQRAEPHVYSDCGNSYFHPAKLAPGAFLRISHPKVAEAEGTPAKVRYRTYSDVDLTSNAGQGSFDPAALDRARFDAMAAGRGDARLLAEILFAKRERPGSKWERMSTRDAALRRLGELPPDRAIPVVERFLAQPQIDPNEYSRAIGVLHELSPKRLAALVRAALAAPPSKQRERVLRELPFMQNIEDPAFVTELVDLARQPGSRDAPYLVDYVAEYKTPAVVKLLLDIQSDPRYARPLQLQAQYDYEMWHSEGIVTVRNSPVGDYTPGHPPPVLVDIEIENTSGKAIEFAYSEPTDILALYLTRADGREKSFVPPRPGVRFYTTPAGQPKHQVRLAPGQRHKLQIGVMDYFDLPTDRGDGLSVWTNVRLPGVHQIADSGGGGSGLNPRP